MTKLMLVLAVSAGAISFVPAPVAAESCTEQYTKCLNDSYYYSGALQSMADLECGAEYAGCVAKKFFTL